MKEVAANEPLIRVNGVSKKFCRDLKLSLWYGLQDIGNELLGREHGAGEDLRPREFWAVRDINFELHRGECLGLIGRNGAGKTTLLKMLTGLIKPDQGCIELRGRIGALIALGAGFSPILTGRENIFVNGSILGLSKHEIERNLDEIIDFADIGDFIDTPVQSYSSGMTVRLGFSIAVKLIKPDILILDEVLAVGDEGFRAKCYEAVANMLENSAVIFVSHSMPAIQRISSKVLLLQEGQVRFDGPPVRGIEQYHAMFAQQARVARRSLGNGGVTLHGAQLLNDDGESVSVCAHGARYRLRFDLTVAPEYTEYHMSVDFKTMAQEFVAQCASKLNGQGFENPGGRHTVELVFDAQLLNPGRYIISLVILDENPLRHLCWEVGLLEFAVKGLFVGAAPVQLVAKWNLLPEGVAS